MCAVYSILSRRVDTKESLFQMPSFTALVQSYFQMASASKIHWANPPCGFDSRHRHHNCSEASCPGAFFILSGVQAQLVWRSISLRSLAIMRFSSREI